MYHVTGNLKMFDVKLHSLANITHNPYVVITHGRVLSITLLLTINLLV